ncbi:MAG: hypothetical protein BWY83_00162 [bacterium ADurb.Bin478]|nr:MAG: hypothetical protein BWY83_00162 [bacterium ADurb.Bin478]
MFPAPENFIPKALFFSGFESVEPGGRRGIGTRQADHIGGILVFIVIAGVVPAAVHIACRCTVRADAVVKMTGGMKAGDRHAAALIPEKAVGRPCGGVPDPVLTDFKGPRLTGRTIQVRADAVFSRSVIVCQFAFIIYRSPVLTVSAGNPALVLQTVLQNRTAILIDQFKTGLAGVQIGLNHKMLWTADVITCLVDQYGDGHRLEESAVDAHVFPRAFAVARDENHLNEAGSLRR